MVEGTGGREGHGFRNCNRQLVDTSKANRTARVSTSRGVDVRRVTVQTRRSTPVATERQLRRSPNLYNDSGQTPTSAISELSYLSLAYAVVSSRLSTNDSSVATAMSLDLSKTAIPRGVLVRLREPQSYSLQDMIALRVRVQGGLLFLLLLSMKNPSAARQ